LTGASRLTGASGVTERGVGESRQPYHYRPGLISCYASSLGIRGPRLPAGGNNTAVGGIKKPDRSWQAGFTGGIGFSSFNESLLDRISVVSTTSTFNALAPTSANRNAGNNGASKDYISNIQPDLSIYAGVFAQKPLSSRWSVSVGLNMHYYSSRIRVGQQVNYYVPATSSLISVPAALSAIQPYPSYSTGDDQAFINRYYYLEVPASVEWRINRSRVLPLFWRGGVVLSELMGSNALYYNNQSGVYLKDNGVINHTQLSFSSGLMAALPFRKIRIQAGPEFQYGVTNLLKTASGSGHLFYGGMRLAFMR
jgi:Outer membrane protein beta-barrel domain